jgi:hypothetical protein
MSELTISNFDATTGELEVRDMSAAEKAQYQNDVARQNEIIEADIKAKEAALAKLKALGLDVNDLKVLGLG